LENLPEELQQLKSLRYFYVHHNRLPVFPEWIAQMHQLERLDLSFNAISDVPDLSNLSKLTDLDLQSNLIGQFPWDLLEMKQLNLLILKDNPYDLSINEKKQLSEIKSIWNKQGKNLMY
jgi:Leucine-rich repeat (LRR) protein